MAEEKKEETQLSEEEKKASRIAERFIEEEDLAYLQDVDRKVQEGLLNIGALEDQKLMILTAIQKYRDGREEKVKQMETKYNIPEGVKWNIDGREKKIVFLNEKGEIINEPALEKEKE